MIQIAGIRHHGGQRPWYLHNPYQSYGGPGHARSQGIIKHCIVCIYRISWWNRQKYQTWSNIGIKLAYQWILLSKVCHMVYVTCSKFLSCPLGAYLLRSIPENELGCTNPKMHQWYIPQCTSPISHNAPLCNKCAHVLTFLLQTAAMWDICLMHYGICELGLLDPKIYLIVMVTNNI